MVILIVQKQIYTDLTNVDKQTNESPTHDATWLSDLAKYYDFIINSKINILIVSLKIYFLDQHQKASKFLTQKNMPIVPQNQRKSIVYARNNGK